MHFIISEICFFPGSHNQYECPSSEWKDDGQYCYLYERTEVDFSDAEVQCEQVKIQSHKNNLIE